MKNEHAIKFGLLAGLGTSVFLFLFYWIDKKLMLSPSVVWSTVFLFVIGMYMAAVEVRKANEGYLAFKPALRTAFIVYLVANFIYYAYNYLLFNVIDPEMLSVQQQFMRETMGQLDGVLNEEQLETIEEAIDQVNYDLWQVFMNFFTSSIWGFLLAAIIARMVRRNPEIEEL